MQKIESGDPMTQSADVRAENIERLKALFPELVTEGPQGTAINVDVLKSLVGDATVTDAEEKYGLNWHGKRLARQIALTPSTGTLRPCPEESVDWNTTQNLMIEGDNLEVLKLLQKSYAGKVKMIYIDPPYNTGKDFVYPDDFRDNIRNYLELTGQTDGVGRRVTSNTEASGRFHTDWLNMMYPRLKLARNLLAPDGCLFISIDEREYSNLRTVCCDIFGEENIVGTVVWRNVTDNNPTNVATEHEYVLVVARGKEAIESQWKTATSDIKDMLLRVGSDLTSKFEGDELQAAYQTWFREHKSELGPLDRYKYIDADGVYTGSQSVHNPGREGYRYNVLHPVTGKPCKQPLMGYRFPEETMNRLLDEGKVLFGEDETKIIELKVYAADFKEKLPSVFEMDGRLGAYDLRDDFPDEGKIFNNPKPVRLLAVFFSFQLKEDGDTVLDFFAGSGAAGKAVFEINKRDSVARKFILVQLPEGLDASSAEQKRAIELCESLGKNPSLSELTKERLRRAGKKIKEENPLFAGDTGFRVFKLDTSNIRPWQPDRDDLESTLLANVKHLVEGRSEQDILFELLLKLGLDLTVPMESRIFVGKTVHSIGLGALMVCLAEEIKRTEVEPLAQGILAWWRELAPAVAVQFVFRDSGFADDVAKTNLAAILEQNIPSDQLAGIRSL
ncbi:MAG: site-specific DNA-methyltransferase [Magnetococcales bacterium]|nr:site-specific DNA-methyltransferase [Magnetococcales bacterium]